MASSRIGGTNLLLLVITLCALLFGVASFVINSGPAPAPNQAARQANVFDPSPEATTSGKRSDDPDPVRPDRRTPTGTERPTEPTRTPDTTPKFEAKPASGQPSDSGDARIDGRVVAGDGKGIAGATVIARRTNLNLEPPELRDQDLERYREAVARFMETSARERRVASTDAEGRFSFTGLDAKLAYDVSASHESAGSGNAERVAAGDSPTIILSADGMLRGRVQTADGKPVTSFKVSAWRPQRQWEATSQSFTGEDGRFAMPGKPGPMMCKVEATGLTQGEAVEGTVGANAPELVITMGRAAIVMGTVRDASGAELAGAYVSLGARNNEERQRGWDGGWGQGQHVTTDSKGRYRFDTLEPKSQTLTATFGEFSNSQTIEAKEGENTLDFTLEAGARVVLKLTGATGEPAQADEVWFQGKNGQWPRATRLPAKEPGRAEFAGLKPGEYTATITSAGWPALRKALTVKEGENQFEFQFAQGATLTGTVTGSGGTKLGGIGVRLRKDDEDAYGGWGTGRYAQVGADGKFKLGPAEPGQWKLEVYATDGWKQVYSTVVALAVGENEQNVVVDSAGSVVVTVTDEAGSPVPWAEVQLRGEQAYNGRTDQAGKATISFVAPGSYQVYASSRALSTRTHTLVVRNGENPLALQLQKANASRVTHVYPDTQAAKLGVQVGDLVFEYNGEAIASWRALGQAIRKTKAADDVIMMVERNGQILTFNLKGGTVGIEGADGVR